MGLLIVENPPSSTCHALSMGDLVLLVANRFADFHAIEK